MAAHAQAVTDPTKGQAAIGMLMRKYPQQALLPGPIPQPSDVRVFRVSPVAISVLDYSKAFGHTDLVIC
jgi:hypothetical protein